ncbi:hypothetical protein Tco_0676082 [Tanacetum coccineum]
MHVIEQAFTPPVLLRLVLNLNIELRSMFEKQAGVEKFDLIQSFHACKQEDGKSVADYVLKMKGYVEQLECLGYMLPHGYLGLPKKAETPQVMMIRDGKIQKANKKSLKAKGKNKVNGKGKDKKEVEHWKRNGHVIFAEVAEEKGIKWLAILRSRNQWEGGRSQKKFKMKKIQYPSEITSNIPQEWKVFEPPQEE